MITPSMIVSHLGKYLPRVTNLFNESLSTSSTSVIPTNTLLIETTVGHGLVSGDYITISAGKIEVPIIDFFEGLFETSIDHDLTEPRKIYDMKTVELSGFTNPDWNSTFDILEVPNRIFFSVANDLPDPILTGSERLVVERSVSIFGIFEVQDVPTLTEFSIQLAANVSDITGTDFSNVEVVKRVRIAACSDIDRAVEIYTKQGADKIWAFLIMTPLDVSKDQTAKSDAYSTQTSGDELRMRLLQNFSIVVFIPTSNSLTGATAQELAYGEIYESFLKILHGFDGFFTAEDASKFVTISTGHGSGIYNTAYYTQVYDFQSPVDITFENGFDFYESTAFRDIAGDLSVNTPGNLEKLNLSIDLDDEPL